MAKEYPKEIVERAKKIKLLVLDVDGVLTDGRIVYSNYGDEIKNFDVNDGLGIMLMKRAGVKCVILTAKASRLVTRRAKELKIDKVYHNFHYKINALKKILRAFKCEKEEICFIGDDVIDIPVLKRVGLAICPPNAMDEVKEFVHFVTEKNGGRGAVREVCDFLLKAQGRWDSTMSAYFE
jgi:3-deoxy-D-manno-octulosonate 8-phosphate phosphatase (KDO 8-P phosphatase)